MHRTRLVFVLVFMLVATLVEPSPATGQTPTPRPSPATLDHFVAYGVKPAKDTPFVPRGPVALPRLGGGPYDLQKVGSLLLPADTNGAGIHDAATHLLEYRLKASKGAPKFTPLANVRVLNQCSDVYVELTKPVAALVPTAKSLQGPVGAPANPAVDHLLCFEAKLQKKDPGGAPLPKLSKGVQVEVADQFQSRRYDLTGITRLCVPTGKSGAPVFLKGPDKGKPAPLAPASVQHADAHLLCYKAKPATTEIPQLGCGPATPGSKGTKIPKQPKHESRPGVFVASQLGALRLDTTKEVELCVPSLAELPITEGFTTLPGDADQLVSAATFDLSSALAWTDAEITVDASGARMLRTSLGIFFAADATVGAANALLARLGAEIVAMVAGPAYVVVRIPDPGSLDALRALATEIEADPAVETVSLDSIPEAAILPPKFPLPTAELQGQSRVLYEERLGYIDHLLAARAPAAWNARAEILTAPALVLADAFGEGVPGAEIAAAYPEPEEFAVGRPDLAEDGFPVRHGYQVLGVIAAAWDAPDGPANCLAQDAVPGPATTGCAVGIYPGTQTPRVRVADMQKLSWLRLEAYILEAVRKFHPNKVVVNASIARFDVIGDLSLALQEGDRWSRLVRDSGLVERFLLVTVSGNVDPRKPSVRTAVTNSSFTAAALHDLIFSERRLKNILVVENRKDSRFPFRPGGLFETSKTGGHISATGTNVWTVVPPRPGDAGWTGTSLAAPQVAGVAAYVWSIDPTLTVEQVRKLILDYAVDGTPKTLDAYATIVGIDAANRGIGEPGLFDVHRALLDLAPSPGVQLVNGEDVFAFFTNLALPADQRRYGVGDLRAARDPTDPPRFDLNADGRFETITVQVGARELSFDETALQFDVDVMCYAAFARTPYDDGLIRVEAGRERCCDYFKQVGRFPTGESCFDCPARRRAAHPRDIGLDPQPLGAWRLSVPSRLVVYEFYFLADGTVMIPAMGRWEKGGTWTSTPHEVNGEILYYDVRIDACTDTARHTRYSFEGTWSPRPLTDCFGVESCFLRGDDCPAMQGLLTTSDGVGPPSPATLVDSGRAEGIDGWAPVPPELESCHGGCFEEWWRSGTLACTPVGEQCVGQAAPACGGFCLLGFNCRPTGSGSCACVPSEP